MNKETPQQLTRNANTWEPDENDQLFCIERLRYELSHPVSARRQLAKQANSYLKHLVNLRFQANQTSRKEQWKHVFDTRRLLADLESDNIERRRVAECVLCTLSALIARSDMMDMETTSIEVTIRSMFLAIFAREKANELAHAAGLPGHVYTLN